MFRHVTRHRIPYAALVGILAMQLVIPGCVKVRSPEIDFSLKVEPTNRLGEYLVTGNTNLPDRTKVTVQGLRMLEKPWQKTQASAPLGTVHGQMNAANYSILARDVVEVSQGKWQTTLKLWQVGQKGNYQEAWQGVEPLAQRLQPSPEITFIALTDPGNQPPNLTQQLQDLGKRLEGDKIFFDAQGNWYAQTQEVRAIALPTGQTNPPTADLPGAKSRLDVRQEIPQVVAATTKKSTEPSPVPPPKDQERQTNAPLAAQEILR